MIEPSEKQLKYCYDILERIGVCEADEYGQPLFETSMEEANKFIKKHRILQLPKLPNNSQSTATDWGNIPNH